MADFRGSMYQGIEEVGGFREITLSQLQGKQPVLNFWAALAISRLPRPQRMLFSRRPIPPHFSRGPPEPAWGS